MTDDRLDRAIDRAVRDIMNADPPGDLRRRVLERLEGATARPPLAWWRPAVYGAAVLATIVLAVLLFRPDGPARPAGTERLAQATQPSAVPPPTAPAAPRAAVAEPGPATASTSRAAAPRPRLTREPIVMPAVADVFGRPSNRAAAASLGEAAPPVAFDAPLSADLAIPPLAPPEAITITPLHTAPIVVPRIEITPIDVRRSQGEKR